MLECAADLGDNGRNVGFIIGTPEAINSTRKSIPHKFTHMRQIGRNRNQENIVRRLKAVGDIMLLCFRIDRPQIVKKLSLLKSSKFGRATRSEIHRRFDYALINEIRNTINDFLLKRNTSINDLVIEVDSDMRKTLKMAGLKTKEPSTAHDLADIVAWANTKNFKHKDVQDIIITNEIEQAILKRIS